MSEVQPPPFPEQKSWQFSLWSLMIGMTGFALFCGLLSVFPTALSQAILGLVWLAATGWLVTGLFFARGDLRAFCIGASIVVSSTWTGIGGRFLQGMFEVFSLLLGGSAFGTATTLWIDHGILAAAAVANGYFCIYARRYFEQQGSDR